MFKAFGKVRISEKKHTNENNNNEAIAENTKAEELYKATEKRAEREIT